MRPKKTILCVDDNEQVLSVRTFLLETRGYRIIATNSAQEALEVLERSLPGTLDLILCDLLMPQMDGNELVRRAKQLHPGLPTMIVSGTVNAFDRALHADVFLPKGASSPAEMIERIRVLVARKRGPKKAAAPVPRMPPHMLRRQAPSRKQLQAKNTCLGQPMNTPGRQFCLPTKPFVGEKVGGLSPVTLFYRSR